MSLRPLQRKSFDEFKSDEQTEILTKARAWYLEHREHVDRLVKHETSLFAPSGSDCWHPELWKEGSWKWFLRHFSEFIKRGA